MGHEEDKAPKKKIKIVPTAIMVYSRTDQKRTVNGKGDTKIPLDVDATSFTQRPPLQGYAQVRRFPHP